MLELWAAFRRVEVSVSLDAFGRRLEYLRYPASWERVEGTVMRYRELSRGALPNLQLQVNATVGLTNFFDLPELLSWAEGHSLDLDLYPVSGRPFLDAQVMPRALKRSVRARIEAHRGRSTKVQRSLRAILAHMDAADLERGGSAEVQLGQTTRAPRGDG